MKMKKFKDKAPMPIIAIDFDDTISIGDDYPNCSVIRPWAKTVINFMHALGIKIVIWTSRDVAYNQEEKQMYDHLTPMLKFLENQDVKYDAINKSVQFSPYAYNGRKIYAHMYVDDRGYGWDGDDSGDDTVMLSVLTSFLQRVCGFSKESALETTRCCKRFEEPEKWMVDAVSSWKRRDYMV